MARIGIKRERERELRHDLWQMRDAIDRYKDAADRGAFICQSQSINIYLPADIDKWDLHMLHWTAWRRGIKSLYYCRSKSLSRAAFAGKLAADGNHAQASTALTRTDYEECLACQ